MPKPNQFVDTSEPKNKDLETRGEVEDKANAAGFQESMMKEPDLAGDPLAEAMEAGVPVAKDVKKKKKGKSDPDALKEMMQDEEEDEPTREQGVKEFVEIIIKIGK